MVARALFMQFLVCWGGCKGVANWLLRHYVVARVSGWLQRICEVVARALFTQFLGCQGGYKGIAKWFLGHHVVARVSGRLQRHC